MTIFNFPERTKVVKILTVVTLLTAVTVSCKEEEKEKDYRDVWCGPYQLTVTEYEGSTPTTCGIGISTFPPGSIYYDKSMQEDVLGLRADGREFMLFKLTDKNGKFEGTDDGEGSYEKGYVTSDGVLFYEKQTYKKGSRCHITRIEGQKDESIITY